MNKLALLLLGVTLLTGCAEEEATKKETKEEKVEVTNQEEAKVEETEEQKEEVSVETKTEITKEEFEAIYKQDPEETQYPDGKFELADGSTVNADYISYGSNDLFDYATAIYSEGKLASIQFETTAAIEDIEKALGIKFEAYQVETNRIGYEITLNDTFSESNIAVYPFEWE